MNYSTIRTLVTTFKAFLLFLFFQTAVLQAQQMPTPKKLTAFSFMTGEWKGKGTYFTPQGANQFDVHE